MICHWPRVTPSSTVMLVMYSRLLDTYATSLASCQKDRRWAVKVARKLFWSNRFPVHVRHRQPLANGHAVNGNGAVIAHDAGADIALRLRLILSKGGADGVGIGLQIRAEAVILGQRLRICLQIGAQPLHIRSEIRHRHIFALQPGRQLLHLPLHQPGSFDDQGFQLLIARALLPGRPLMSRRSAAGRRPGAAGFQLPQGKIQLLCHLEQIRILGNGHLLGTAVGRGRHRKRHGPSLPFSYTADRL